MHTVTKQEHKAERIDLKALAGGDREFLRQLIRAALEEVQELRWFYARGDLAEARSDLAVWLARWAGKYPRLTAWVEENLEETLSFYRFPRQHHKHLKNTNMRERLNQQIKRRAQVVRIFPNAQSCLRLIRALAVETHGNWLEQHRYLNMEELREHQKTHHEVSCLSPPRGAALSSP
jgi:putative transposase